MSGAKPEPKAERAEGGEEPKAKRATASEMVLHVDSTFGEDGEHLGDNILVYSASDDAYWACWSNVRRGPRNAIMVCGEQ